MELMREWYVILSRLSALLAGPLGELSTRLELPLASAFLSQTQQLFKVFEISQETMLIQAGAALVVGLIAAAWPAWKMSRIDIVQGLRHVA